jgi:hypothetical protein
MTMTKKIRDEIRRTYLLNGPTQLVSHNFPRKQQGDHFRSFQESCFKKFDWLEYSVENKFGYEIFTQERFKNWRKALDAFKDHIGGVNSYHNNAR